VLGHLDLGRRRALQRRRLDPERRLTGRTSSRSISSISISAVEGSNSAALIAEIASLMRQRRNLQPNEDDDFNIFDTRQIAETLSSSTRMMTTLLAAVAGVSLFVGGIGIMNIMLVSVTERTREIGIRLAIGAHDRDIRVQFLIEAMVLSSLGGIIGVLLGIGISQSLSVLNGWPVLVSTNAILLAVGFSALVGVLFGFYPAHKAAQLDPIEALRFE
jgi:putative ABC transport system permease protein